jgi:hypothetical protein
MRARRLRSGVLFSAAFVLVTAVAPAVADYVTFGNGYSSKWDDPVHGTPATITWGWMLDGTTVSPSVLPFSTEVTGGSNLTQLRNDVDAVYGAGAFDAAIQNALDTWELVAGVTFVGPVADSGLPVGGAGATSPDIRIGAFTPSGVCCFDFVAAVGFGPPGDDQNFPDPLAGDIMFNLNATFIMPAGAEGATITQLGNDLEGLTLHELGHAAMGLGHPAAGPPEVMYVGAGCCTVINREPSPDDIAGGQVVYGPSATPACNNTIDDDGDGLYDLADPGCANGSDTSERSAVACDNGLDDDGDGRGDFDPITFADPAHAAGEGDPGCQSPTTAKEDPKCQNGVDDDGQIGTDFDGGESILGQGNGDPNGADPQCSNKPWKDKEAPSSCGLGFELALVLPLLLGLRRRARRA